MRRRRAVFASHDRPGAGNVRRSLDFQISSAPRASRPARWDSASLHDIGLAEAREVARKNRNLLRERTLSRSRNVKRRSPKNLAAGAAIMTFDQARSTYIAQHSAAWTNPVHAAQWPASLAMYASPIIGKMSVNDIDTPHILKVLTPIWNEKAVTAKRLRGPQYRPRRCWVGRRSAATGRTPMATTCQIRHDGAAICKHRSQRRAGWRRSNINLRCPTPRRPHSWPNCASRKVSQPWRPSS